MNTINSPTRVHPKGEPTDKPVKSEAGLPDVGSQAVRVETFGGAVHVEWDPQSAVTPIGQLAFFIDFLKTADLFEPWVEQCPLSYKSNNAPFKRDVLGTILLSILEGHDRYAHITSLRADTVNPRLLGMSKVVSEDSARRSFQRVDAAACASWQQSHLRRCYEPLLYEPWILDIDSTVKPLYGHHEGAVLGYNPHKPGRPSHAYHTYVMGATRLILDVEVQPGNQTAGAYGLPGLERFLDTLSPAARPFLVRGDVSYGNENIMTGCEERAQNYLFKLRRGRGVQRLVEDLFATAEWQWAGADWQGTESPLQLMGWSRARRVIVLRRELKGDLSLEHTKDDGQLRFAFVDTLDPGRRYEYVVLVTSSRYDLGALGQLYRDRADAENVNDELKNHWGWGGFMTQDLGRCQVMARNTAQVYNWWSLFVRLAIPERHAEAITSRPLLLHGVGKETRHGGRVTLTLTSVHANWRKARQMVTALAAFLRTVRSNAEQLDWYGRWRLILSRAFRWFLRDRMLKPAPLLPQEAT
jgi:hypothetical protein